MSEESKEKMRLARKRFLACGGKPWIAGRRHTKETKKKISEKVKIIMKDIVLPQRFKKGQHASPSTEIKKGQRLSPKTEFKKGQKSWNAGTRKPFYPKPHPKYGSFHQWLRYNFGSANRCENELCDKTSNGGFDWAHLNDKPWKKNRSYFVMLCKKCHYHYDRNKKEIKI